MAEQHPEHASEQVYLRRARAALDASIDHVGDLLVVAKADRDNPDARALAANLTGRLQRLRDAGSQAACFARLDDEDRETFYIGRQHIADADQTALVIDWRARAAEPFYRATGLNTMGCVRRRQFVLEADDIVEIYDTDLTDPDAGAGIPDPLLAEINRARTGSMREIVATIQGEQDAIVRAPLDLTLIVQGGPGTGKTAVGLHRAAYLLFEHRDLLHREGVLVVGPNRRFLEYIADVLPSLGERSFRQVVPSDLGDIDLDSDDDLDIEIRRLAGDLRMAQALRSHLASAATRPTEDVRIRSDRGSATLSAETARNAMVDTLATTERIGPARELWMSRLIGDLREQVRQREVGGATITASDFARAVRKSKDFTAFAKAHWPATKPGPAVKSFWRDGVRNETLMRRAGFEPHEIETLQRRPARRALGEVDRALLDEAAFQLGQRFNEYGHVILDEAQDLSPMALRMVARRAKNRSFTILGDVAQCSGTWMYDDWTLPLEALATPDTAIELAELTVGYRVPAEFIDLANALLPDIAPGLSETSSVRPAAQAPSWTPVHERELAAEVVDRALTLAARWQTTAVICPVGDLLDQLDDAIAVAMADVVTGATGDTAPSIDVLAPAAAKGLEFDAVVVVEPAAMVDHAGSRRPLFVALTRAVQHLEIVGSMPPPAGIGSLQ